MCSMAPAKGASPIGSNCSAVRSSDSRHHARSPVRRDRWGRIRMDSTRDRGPSCALPGILDYWCAEGKGKKKIVE